MRVLHLLVLVFLVCGAEYGDEYIEEQSQSLSFEDIVSSLSIQYVTFDDYQEDANVRSVEQKNKQEELNVQDDPIDVKNDIELNIGKQVGSSQQSQQIFAQVKEINTSEQVQPQEQENQEELKVSSVQIDIGQQVKKEVQLPIEQQQAPIEQFQAPIEQSQAVEQTQAIEQQQAPVEEQLIDSQTNQDMLDALDDEPQLEQDSAENLLVVFNEAEYEEQQDNLSNVVLDFSGQENSNENENENQKEESIQVQTLIETEVEQENYQLQDQDGFEQQPQDYEDNEQNINLQLDDQIDPQYDDSDQQQLYDQDVLEDQDNNDQSLNQNDQQLIQESSEQQIDEQQNLIDIDSYNIETEGIDNMTVHLESLQEQETITKSFDEQTQSQLEQDSLYKEFEDLEIAADEMQQEMLLTVQDSFPNEEQNLDTFQQDQEEIYADQQELSQEPQEQELIQEDDQQINVELDDQNDYEYQDDAVKLYEIESTNNDSANQNLYDEDNVQLEDADLLGSDYILKIYEQFQQEDSQHIFPKIDQQVYNKDIDELTDEINQDIQKETHQNIQVDKEQDQDQELDNEVINEDQTLIDYALFYDDPLPQEIQEEQSVQNQIPEQKHEPIVEMKLLSQEIDAELPDLYTQQEEKSLIDNLKQSQQKLREKISRVFDKKQEQLDRLEDATKEVEFIATNDEEYKEQRKQQIYDQIKNNLEQKKQKLIEEPNTYKQDYPQEYEIEEAFFDWNMNKGIVLEGLPETTLVNLEQKVTTPIEQEELRTPIFEFVETKTTIQELDIQRQIDEFLGLDGEDKNYNLSDFDPLLDDFHSFLSVNQKLRVNLRKRKVLSV